MMKRCLSSDHIFIGTPLNIKPVDLDTSGFSAVTDIPPASVIGLSSVTGRSLSSVTGRSLLGFAVFGVLRSSGLARDIVGVVMAFPADVVEDAEEPIAPMTSFSRIAAIWDFIGVASGDTPSTTDSVFGLTATTGVLIFSGTMVPMVTLVDCIEEPSLIGVLVNLIVFDSDDLTGVGVHLPATMDEPDGQDLPSEAILVRKA